ncbi:MAG: 5'/3'-nucleotidase SurE [Alphaproteobacteria bacterium]
MLEKAKNQGACRVLLCNDDGIDAPGFAVLEKFARSTFAEVWVVAPASEQSAKSRGLTVRQSIEVEQRGDKRFAVHGTPVDCMVVALNALMDDQRPDLVLSGINNGSNLAEDIGYSGTVGCALEARLHQVPAIAFSQCFLSGEAKNIPWQIAESHLKSVVDLLWNQKHQQDMVYNVNFPPVLFSDQAEIHFTHQGRRVTDDFKPSLSVRETGENKLSVSIDMLRREHRQVDSSDLLTVEQGRISISKLGINQSHLD